MRGDLEWGSIPRLVQEAADCYGEAEAVAGARTRISYRGLGRQVRRAAAAMIAAGIEPGDRVALWAPNTPGFVVAALGAVSAGAVLVPLGTRLKGAEVVELLRRTGASALFVTDTFLGVSYVSALRAAVGAAARPVLFPRPPLPVPLPLPPAPPLPSSAEGCPGCHGCTPRSSWATAPTRPPGSGTGAAFWPPEPGCPTGPCTSASTRSAARTRPT
ncbi:AMP-binding protein [Streptacidiphilus sp. 4-A2]|nr:AMP-binding protein [Streptacidiphilus sp. 4-A2]